MEKKMTLILALGISALLTFAQNKGGGIIDGNTWAFHISAPDGWVWDSASLCYQGIQGLFYKEDSKFSPSKLHMYISPSQKTPNGPITLGDFIEMDEAAFMRSEPGNLVMDLSPYSPSMEYTFSLRDFDDQNEKYYQSIAYYEGERAYFVFILFCRSAEERERSRSSFLELLDSFAYIPKE
jgi:hypothetical protein